MKRNMHHVKSYLGYIFATVFTAAPHPPLLPILTVPRMVVMEEFYHAQLPFQAECLIEVIKLLSTTLISGG